MKINKPSFPQALGWTGIMGIFIFHEINMPWLVLVSLLALVAAIERQAESEPTK